MFPADALFVNAETEYKRERALAGRTGRVVRHRRRQFHLPRPRRTPAQSPRPAMG
jgi:hypothetical protein